MLEKGSDPDKKCFTIFGLALLTSPTSKMYKVEVIINNFLWYTWWSLILSIIFSSIAGVRYTGSIYKTFLAVVVVPFLTFLFLLLGQIEHIAKGHIGFNVIGVIFILLPCIVFIVSILPFDICRRLTSKKDEN